MSKKKNTVNGVFDALYDLSTRVDLQAEKILELKSMLDKSMELLNRITIQIGREWNKELNDLNDKYKKL